MYKVADRYKREGSLSSSREFKAAKYGNSYQINKILAGYTGIDTINLTTELRNFSKRNAVSVQRDVAAMLGRQDFNEHIINLVQEGEKNVIQGFLYYYPLFAIPLLAYGTVSSITTNTNARNNA